MDTLEDMPFSKFLVLNLFINLNTGSNIKFILPDNWQIHQISDDQKLKCHCKKEIQEKNNSF